MNTENDKGKVHHVRENECILGIAVENGLFWQTVWNHPRNAELKKKRSDPNLLLEGDEVFVPDLREKQEICATEQKHCFRKKGVPVLFRLRLLENDEPQVDVPYILNIDGILYKGRSDGEGIIEVAVPPVPKEGILTLGEGDEAEEIQVALGGADPIGDVEGVRKRLFNLGYDCGAKDDEEALAAAIFSFQLNQGIDVTGELDEATRDALRKAHGC